MSQLERDKIIAALESAGVEYTRSTHEPVTTSQHASDIRGVALSSGAKALVVKGKKTKDHYLCVIPAHKKLDTKKLKEVIGEKVNFASNPEELTGCVPGSVPPFGSVLGLKTYACHALEDILNFNCGMLTESINLTKEAFGEVEQPVWVDIS